MLYKRMRSPLTHVLGKKVSNGTNVFSGTGSVNVLTTTLLGKNRCGNHHVLDPLKMGAVYAIPHRLATFNHAPK